MIARQYLHTYISRYLLYLTNKTIYNVPYKNIVYVGTTTHIKWYIYIYILEHYKKSFNYMRS